MKLFEHEGKELLRTQGIKVPEAMLAFSVADTESAARELGGPVMVKAQVLSGGRGKAGGIQAAANGREAGAIASRLLGSHLSGHKVEKLLIEEHTPIARELYLAITIDAQSGQPLLLFSPHGGVDIEDLAAGDTGLLRSHSVDLLEGLQPYLMRRVAKEAGLGSSLLTPLGDVAAKLYGAFRAADAAVAEINPLVLTNEGGLVALDAKFDIDDYALHRQRQWPVRDHLGDESATEARARETGLTYVELDGTIGIAGNGAGLMMLTVDLVEQIGGKAANFCDAGGARARPGTGEGAIRWWTNVVSIVLSNPKVRVFLFNLHGGNHRGDEVAQGLIRGLRRIERNVPMVVRLSGTRQAEGRDILAAAGIDSYDTLEGVADAAVALANRLEQEHREKVS